MNKIMNIKDFSRLPKTARLNMIKNYPIKGIRISKDSNNIEIIVNNWRNKQIWIPLDYCLNDTLLVDDWKYLDEIISKRT